MVSTHGLQQKALATNRPKCPKCNEYPEGFRSKHELNRHTNRVHTKTRKMWITVDVSPGKTFLASCKACQAQKRYSESYNAAAHLRRHFDLDQRPSMKVAKFWLREVEEVVAHRSGERGVQSRTKRGKRHTKHATPPSQSLTNRSIRPITRSMRNVSFSTSSISEH